MSVIEFSKLKFSTNENFHREVFRNEEFILDNKTKYWTFFSNTHCNDIEKMLNKKLPFSGEINTYNNENTINFWDEKLFSVDFFDIKRRILKNRYRIVDTFFAELFKDSELQSKQRKRLFLQNLTSRMNYWETVVPKTEHEKLKTIEKKEKEYFHEFVEYHEDKKNKIINNYKKRVTKEKSLVKIANTEYYLEKNEFKTVVEAAVDSFVIQKKELKEKYKKMYEHNWHEVRIFLEKLTKANNEFVESYSTKKKEYRHELDMLSIKQLKNNHKKVKKLKRNPEYFEKFSVNLDKQLIDEQGPNASISNWKKGKIISLFEARNFTEIDALRAKYDKIIEKEFFEIKEHERNYNDQYTQKIESFFLKSKIFKDKHFTQPYRLLKYNHKKHLQNIDKKFSNSTWNAFERYRTNVVHYKEQIKNCKLEKKENLKTLISKKKHALKHLILWEKKVLNHFYVDKPPKEYRFVFKKSFENDSKKEFGEFYKDNSKLFSNQQKRTFQTRYKTVKENFHSQTTTQNLYSENSAVSAYEILDDQYDKLTELFNKAGINGDFLQTKADTISELWLNKITVLFAIFFNSKLLVINLQKYNFDKKHKEFKDFLNQLKFVIKENNTKIVFISNPNNYKYVESITEQVSFFFNGICVEQGDKQKIKNSPCNELTKYFLSSKPVPQEIEEKYRNISSTKKVKMSTITIKHWAIKNEDI